MYNAKVTFSLFPSPRGRNQNLPRKTWEKLQSSGC